MRFATLPNGGPDGRLHFVSPDHRTAAPVRAAATLQAALESWSALSAELERDYADFLAGYGDAIIGFDPSRALAPLPRAWQWVDGSAFYSHGDLMRQVFDIKVVHALSRPLMYQGVSDRFLAPTEATPFPFEADQIDFEGEFGIITDAVPMGADSVAARDHIRLLVQINDWSLRALGPVEMKTGFGVIQCKSRSSMAPVAVTSDEIGSAWHKARIGLALKVDFNGRRFGAANGSAMSVGFDELIAHAAYSRDLVAGTVIGSGTVSNCNYREIGSSCISERRAIETQDHGRPQAGYMRFGDRVRMEARLMDRSPVFGAIDQEVVELVHQS